MMKLIYIMLSFLVVACSYASNNITDRVSLLSNNFHIKEKDRQCFLIHKGQEKPLAPKPPCYFIRNSDKKPKYFSYSKVRVDAILIVIGTAPKKEMRKEWGLDKKSVCGTEAQGVLIKKNEVLITKKVLKDGLLCRDSGSDEKNFWELAHED